MSRGIWATWYDLAPEDREAYVAWERDEYLPTLGSDRRYNWVTRYGSRSGHGIETGVFGETIVDAAKEGLGTATEYLVLIGADSPHTFLNPLELDSAAPPMLSRRRNVRHAVFLEEETAPGPQAPTDGGPDVASPAIRFGTFYMKTAQEDFDAGRWYAQSRLREMSMTPGCVRTRKLMCVAGWGKHGILYEFTDPEVRAEAWKQFKKQRDNTPDSFWTIGPQTLHAPGSPFLGQRTYSSV